MVIRCILPVRTSENSHSVLSIFSRRKLYSNWSPSNECFDFFFFFNVTERSFLRRHHRWKLVNGTESFKKLVLEPEIDISILNISMIWGELFLKIQLSYQWVRTALQQTKTRLSNVENIKKMSVSILFLK